VELHKKNDLFGSLKPMIKRPNSYSSRAAYEANQAIKFASLRNTALEHAKSCLNACGGWTVETLGHNIESAFGAELDAEKCDAIAAEALRRWPNRKQNQ
jgi:hypothetical protein